MLKKRRTSTFELGDELTTAMERLFDRDGITASEQVRRALRPFLEKKGILKTVKPERQQPASRRRS